MNIFKLASLRTPLFIGALLLGASMTSHADNLQEATRLFKKGQQDQALGKVNSFLADKPRDAQGRFLKGLILTGQGKTNDAIQIFTALTKDFPELPEPYNNLAVLYASQSQYDKAKSALEMAIRTHPSYATAHENLGDIYAKLASQAYDRALKLDSSNTATQTKLALIQDLFTEAPQPVRAQAAVPAAKPAQPAKPVATAPVKTAAPVAKPLEKFAVAPVTKVAEPIKTTTKPQAPAQNAAIEETVNAWASAWQKQNVKKYLSFYAKNFRTPNGESRAEWAKTRNERISKPKNIEISISNIRVNFTDSNHATVKFRQLYRANHFKATGNKTMEMVKSGDTWLIQEENAK